MLHEMAHLYDLTHGTKDVSNNGYYHNLKFKETAEAHGLHIKQHATYGWTITTLTEETAAWLAAQPSMETSAPAARRSCKSRPPPAMRTVTKRRTRPSSGGDRQTSKNRSTCSVHAYKNVRKGAAIEGP